MARATFTTRKAQDRLIREAIKTGVSATAKNRGISRSKVYSVFRKRGLKPPSRQPGYTGPPSDPSRNSCRAGAHGAPEVTHD